MSFLDEFNDRLDQFGNQGMSEKQVMGKTILTYVLFINKVSADLYF